MEAGNVGDTEKTLFNMNEFQNQMINRRSLNWSQIDAVRSTDHSIKYYEIFSTALSIILRIVSVCINLKLIHTYYSSGNMSCFIWTTVCIIVPMIITIFIHAIMCYQDGEFHEGTCLHAIKTLFLAFISSFLFRYWKSLRYAVTCKIAESRGDKAVQMRFYKMTIREESDVAFIRLFECFLEAAPQKILQISIVLSHSDKITPIQTIAICSYFGSMAWCLAAYNRCNRFAQIDKNNINIHGLVLQLGWHFCISVSRTLCIAFIASLYPLWTLTACLLHATISGIITFFTDRPQFAALKIFNFLFCLILGIVYLFTYIAVKEGPTKKKYTVYYFVNSLENIFCVTIFIMYASDDLKSNSFLFYPLCVMAIAFYYVGIAFMIIYYLYFHPHITSRQSKFIMNSN